MVVPIDAPSEVDIHTMLNACVRNNNNTPATADPLDVGSGGLSSQSGLDFVERHGW